MLFDHASQASSSNAYKYKYQGQELQETGFYSFKWRNYMPDVGWFFNVDVLAEEYDYQTPYAFSENKVTNHIELEGLEAVMIGPGGVPIAPPPPAYGGSTTGFHPIGQRPVRLSDVKDAINSAKDAVVGVALVTTAMTASNVLNAYDNVTSLCDSVMNSESDGKSDKKSENEAKPKTKAEERAEKLSKKQRPGKDFTKAGKEAVINLNKEKNGGKTICEHCGVETLPAKKSEKGVTPDKREDNVDHIERKRDGRSGTL
ncbi:hypothetical protein BA768_13850 [Chryseobacterium sp. CBo1]|nr:hypothetical protein BA768_13850 [Chryseobacterium sp. CBo1]